MTREPGDKPNCNPSPEIEEEPIRAETSSHARYGGRFVAGTSSNTAAILSVCALVVAIAALAVGMRNSRQRTPDVASAPQTSMPASTREKVPPGRVNAQSRPVAEPTPWVDPSPVESAVKDVEIDRALNLKLLHDPAFQRYPIDASANNSRVTLRGTVPTERLRARADSIAKSIPGVRGVYDRLTVQRVD